MVYESNISFTLDTICPWTYLGKRRLGRALEVVRARNPPVNFTVTYQPYQLYPDAPQEGEDKYAWYRRSRYGDSEEKMAMYTTLMTAYGLAETPAIHYKFHGTVANTLHAHRVIRHFQSRQQSPSSSSSSSSSSSPSSSSYPAGTADRLIDSLYRRFFEEEQHPSSEATLLAACADAGISAEDARAVIVDDDGQSGLTDVRAAIAEQAGNGVDAVPYVVVEGRKRDFTVVGCKEVEDYIKVLEQVIKESA